MNETSQHEPVTTTDDEVRPLHDLCSLLEARGIWYLVHGGWAAEYYLQRARPHRDIDLASRSSERAKFLECFPAADELRGRNKIKFVFQGVPTEVAFSDPPRGDIVTVHYKSRSLRVPQRMLVPVCVPIRGRVCPILPCAMLCLNMLVMNGGYAGMSEKYKTDFDGLMSTLPPAERDEVEQLWRQPDRFLDRLARRLRR